MTGNRLGAVAHERVSAMAWGHRVNLVLSTGLGGATLFAFFGLPAWLLPDDPAWGWLLVPIALATNSLWSLGHEAIHGNFHPDRRINNWAGRAMAVLLGSSLRLLRFAHLMHHRFNRYRLDRPDILDPSGGGRALAKARYFGDLFLGHYAAEVIAPILCLLPKPAVSRIIDSVYRHPDPSVQAAGGVARQAILRDKNLNEIRGDALAAAALVSAGLWAYGGQWPLLAAFLLARGMLVSIIDNVYHFGTPPDRRDFAWNLRLPAACRFVILNMNFHRVHHRHPDLPWWRLSARFQELGARFDAGFFAMAFRQFGGPLPADECLLTARA
jgi:fatty acid desaturase